MNDIDVTEVIDRSMPRSWRCPHCGYRNITGNVANEIFPFFEKYIAQCEKCGCLHIFRFETS